MKNYIQFILVSLVTMIFYSKNVFNQDYNNTSYTISYDNKNYTINIKPTTDGDGIVISTNDNKRDSVYNYEWDVFKNSFSKLFFDGEHKNELLIPITDKFFFQIKLAIAKYEMNKNIKSDSLNNEFKIAKIRIKTDNFKVPIFVNKQDVIINNKRYNEIGPEKIDPNDKGIFKKFASFGKQISKNKAKIFNIDEANDDFYKINIDENFFNIKKIEMAFEDGTIKDIIIKGTLDDEKEEIFFQNKQPISILLPRSIMELNTYGNNVFSFEKDYKKYYIDLSDVIYYERLVAMSSGLYKPKDDIIILDKEKTEAYLLKEPYFNNFDIRLYTDITGFQEKSPNGLVQFEGSYKILINTIYCYKKILLSNYITPYVIFSKIEDKQRTLELNTSLQTMPDSFLNSFQDTASFLYTSVFDLYRYSNLKIGLDWNVFSVIGVSNSLKINLNTGIFRTAVDSSLIIEEGKKSYRISDNRNILSWYIIPTLHCQAIDGRQLDADFSVGFMYIKPFEKGIKYINTTKANISDYKIHKPSNSWLFPFQMDINIHPNPENQDKSIFFRGSFIVNTKSMNNLALQIGYATPFNQLFTNNK